MGSFFDALTPKQQDFIAKQKIFFVATAPKQGRLNLSPKGLGGFKILGPNEAAFVNLVGSGNETAAHLIDDGRIIVMFCAFEGSPMILKLYGEGRPVYPGHEDWEELAEKLEAPFGTRQIIHFTFDSVQSSCGYGVPLFEYQGERSDLTDWMEQRGEEGLRKYQEEKNRVSIDGLGTGL